MQYNDDEQMNKNNNQSHASASEEGPESSPSSPVGPADSPSESSESNSTPQQFESRRARRMSETSMIPQIPAPVKTVTETAPAHKATLPTLGKTKPVTNEGQAPTPVANVRPSKEYWGGTAMLTSLLVFLIAQVVAALVLIAYIIFGDLEVLKSIQDGTGKVEDMIGSTPWLLLFTQATVYAAWLGSLWWVTRYRSGVQRGVKFWEAFKKNFRLTHFKPIDLAYGAGIAGVMVGLQFAVLNVLPSIFPSMRVEEAGNTDTFTSFEGPWFYIIAFGLGGLLGPICEELFFRGFLLRGFSNHFSHKNSGRNMDLLEDGLGEHVSGLKSMIVSYRGFTHNHRYVISVIITSILFGLMHYQGHWLTVAFTALLGVVLATVTVKLNRLYPAIIAHVLYNTTLFVILAITR